MSLDNNTKTNLIDQKSIDNVEDNNTMSEEELRAKEERRQNSLNNLKPFKAYNSLSPEELERQKEITNRGAKNRGILAQKEKSMKDSAKYLLRARVSREQCEKYLGPGVSLEGIDTMQDLIMARMFKEILENGNTKAAEFIRDTSGNKPTAELNVKADVISTNDRALIDKLTNRLGLVDIIEDDDTENG